MVPCHCCHIYRILRSKEVRRGFKVIILGGNASQKRGTIFMGKGILIIGVLTAVLKLCCKSYWVL